MKHPNYSTGIPVLFLLLLFTSQLFGQGFKFSENKEGIEISENGKKVLFYQKSPKSLQGEYERANYIHPLYDLQEEVITEDFPEDHLHQRGIFWAWHQIMVNNTKIADGWTLENIAWEVVDTKTEKSNKQASLGTEVLWVAKMPNHNASEPIIKENATITVFPATAQHRILDFEIKLTALTDHVKLGGSEDIKGYGGFSPRIKLPVDITFISDNKSISPQNTAVAAGPWMDFYGSFHGENQEPYGIAVFCNPKYPNQTQKWILRKEKSMQNPVFPGSEPIALSRTKPLILKYRMVIHKGTAEQADLENLYQQYMKNTF